MGRTQKQQLVASIAKKVSISQKSARAALDHIVKLAYENTKTGFVLPGLGKFSVSKAQSGRTPASASQATIRPRRIIRFRPTKRARHKMLMASRRPYRTSRAQVCSVTKC